ncbi:MAG TPA: hypothetical protein VGD94_17685 [Vicinamibacterales bacterium]
MPTSNAAAPDGTIRARFTAALDNLVETLKADRSILAALLGGSLAHDMVWEGSDIDLVLVTVDDRKIEAGSRCLDADGVNVHAILLPRAEFRRIAEGTLRNSFMHSFLAKGRLLYTHDPTIQSFAEALTGPGRRDRDIQMMRAATGALGSIYKAHKWFLTRGDLDYTALWILYAATSLAQVEVIGAGRLADREVIPQALTLNPSFFKTIYTDLLNTRKTRRNVQTALDAVNEYMESRIPSLFAPILDYLAEVREARSCREIDTHFARTLGVEGVSAACEYLADRKVIGRASTPVHVTKKSNVVVEELAFFALERR